MGLRAEKMKINQISPNKSDPITIESNIIVIVGHNGAGKTRFLTDLYNKITNKNTKTMWDLDIKIDIEDSDLNDLYSSLKISNDGNYYPSEKMNANGETEQSATYRLTPNEYEIIGKYINKEHTDETINESSIDKFKKLCKECSTHFLPVDYRTIIKSESQIKQAGTRTHELPDVLEQMPEMMEMINREIAALFNRQLHLSYHALPTLKLLTTNTNSPTIPDFDLKIRHNNEDFESWKISSNAINLNDEGHGIKAFFKILFTYYLSTNKILLIDEPELHLHPSVKSKLGMNLGDLAKQNTKQIVCTTHDSSVLQGILDSGCSVNLIRLHKSHQHHDAVSYFYDKSKNTQSTLFMSGQLEQHYLQLLFLECAVLVEGSSDRSVYEFILRDRTLLTQMEYRVISCGGHNNIKNILRLSQTFKIPIAMILDFDVLIPEKSDQKLPPILQSIINEHSSAKKDAGLEKILKSTAIALRDKLSIESSKEDYREKRQKMSFDQNDADINNLLSKLEEYMIFIVPVGGLEAWGKFDKGSNKKYIPEKIIESYNDDKTKFTEMVSFLKKISDSLTPKQ